MVETKEYLKRTTGILSKRRERKSEAQLHFPGVTFGLAVLYNRCPCTGSARLALPYLMGMPYFDNLDIRD
ncbi:MAG TPA: hypothetical protein VF899_10380 [Pyrinomonadaceae bacterium]